MTDRPFWQPIPGLTEDTARFFARHTVLAVEYGWEYAAVDRVNSWLDFKVRPKPVPGSGNGDLLVSGLRLAELPPHVRFSKIPSGNRGLFELDQHIADRVAAIDKWDKEHEKEIAEFERLKVKLGR